MKILYKGCGLFVYNFYKCFHTRLHLNAIFLFPFKNLLYMIFVYDHQNISVFISYHHDTIWMLTIYRNPNRIMKFAKTKINKFCLTTRNSFNLHRLLLQSFPLCSPGYYLTAAITHPPYNTYFQHE